LESERQRERDVKVYDGNDFVCLLESRRCTAADIEAVNAFRLGIRV
jgi:hypothetical protein